MYMPYAQPAVNQTREEPHVVRGTAQLPRLSTRAGVWDPHRAQKHCHRQTIAATIKFRLLDPSRF